MERYNFCDSSIFGDPLLLSKRVGFVTNVRTKVFCHSLYYWRVNRRRLLYISCKRKKKNRGRLVNIYQWDKFHSIISYSLLISCNPLFQYGYCNFKQKEMLCIPIEFELENEYKNCMSSVKCVLTDTLSR